MPRHVIVKRRPPHATGALDIYGGYTSIPVTGGATGHFRVAKLGLHWVLATPLGNAFWMRSVYYVTGDTHTTEQGTTYNAVFTAKYPSSAIGWNRQNTRLVSWGFNAIGPGSFRITLASDSENTVPVPFTYTCLNPGINGYDTGAGSFKMLYRGLDTSVSTVFNDSVAGHYPDAYDPVFATNAAAVFAGDTALIAHAASAYFIGAFGDDTDFLNGFGPGVDFATDPAGKYHWHLGYLALVMAPTQANNVNASGSPAYTDTEVHTKTALQSFLTARYGTVAALNTAWGSSYSTLGSSGGWPTGSGLLDENGRTTHAYLGTSYNDPYNLTGMNATVKADLDLFLYAMAKQFFQVEYAAFKLTAPNALFFGPTNLGGAGWRSPARGPILQAAGEVLDCLAVGTDASQAQTDFIATWAGDHPVHIWEGTTGNADSGRFRTTMEAATWAVSTQAARGAIYAADVSHLLTRKGAATGTYPYVGLTWWQFVDNFAEGANWGVVSLRDNAYDGVEAKIAAGTDSGGYTTGGEEANYGDFMTSAITAHAAVEATLIANT